MFDPVKIEAEDLDQLYAFDMALASGVDQVSSSISAIDDAQGEELDTAIEKLSELLDDLNERMNQRSELLTSGTRLPSDQYQVLLDRLEPLPPYEGGTGGDISAPPGSTGTGSPSMGGMAPGSTPGGIAPPISNAGMGSNIPSSGMAGTGSSGAGESARVSGMAGSDEAGIPTVNLGAGSSTGGVESASSPATAPGAPGHDVVEGMQMGRNVEQVADVDSDGSTKRDA
jgi:hypothetical protein